MPTSNVINENDTYPVITSELPSDWFCSDVSLSMLQHDILAGGKECKCTEEASWETERKDGTEERRRCSCVDRTTKTCRPPLRMFLPKYPNSPNPGYTISDNSPNQPRRLSQRRGLNVAVRSALFAIPNPLHATHRPHKS